MHPSQAPSELYFFRVSLLLRHVLHAKTTGRTGENMTGVYPRSFARSGLAPLCQPGPTSHPSSPRGRVTLAIFLF